MLCYTPPGHRDGAASAQGKSNGFCNGSEGTHIDEVYGDRGYGCHPPVLLFTVIITTTVTSIIASTVMEAMVAVN